jgi:hypothetical protein
MRMMQGSTTLKIRVCANFQAPISLQMLYIMKNVTFYSLYWISFCNEKEKMPSGRAGDGTFTRDKKFMF